MHLLGVDSTTYCCTANVLIFSISCYPFLKTEGNKCLQLSRFSCMQSISSRVPDFRHSFLHWILILKLINTQYLDIVLYWGQSVSHKPNVEKKGCKETTFNLENLMNLDHDIMLTVHKCPKVPLDVYMCKFCIYRYMSISIWTVMSFCFSHWSVDFQL